MSVEIGVLAFSNCAWSKIYTRFNIAPDSYAGYFTKYNKATLVNMNLSGSGIKAVDVCFRTILIKLTKRSVSR